MEFVMILFILHSVVSKRRNGHRNSVAEASSPTIWPKLGSMAICHTTVTCPWEYMTSYKADVLTTEELSMQE